MQDNTNKTDLQTSLALSPASKATFKKSTVPKKFVLIKPKILQSKKQHALKLKLDETKTKTKPRGNKSGRFVCGPCPRRFRLNRRLLKHEAQCRRNYPPEKIRRLIHFCEFCKIRFEEREELKQHLVTHANNECQFRTIPSKTYSGQRSVIKSAISGANEPQSNSDSAQFTASLRRTYSSLTSPSPNCNSGESGSATTNQERGERYFKVESRYIYNHATGKYVNVKFQCALCNAFASNEKNMKTHVGRHNSDVSGLVLTLKCPDCHYTTTNQTGLQVHRLSHEPDINLQKIPVKTYSRKDRNPSGTSSVPTNSLMSSRRPQDTEQSTFKTVPQTPALINQSGMVINIKSEFPDSQEVIPRGLTLLMVLDKNGDTSGTEMNVKDYNNSFNTVTIKQEPMDYEGRQSDEEILP